MLSKHTKTSRLKQGKIIEKIIDALPLIFWFSDMSHEGGIRIAPDLPVRVRTQTGFSLVTENTPHIYFTGIINEPKPIGGYTKAGTTPFKRRQQSSQGQSDPSSLKTNMGRRSVPDSVLMKDRGNKKRDMFLP